MNGIEELSGINHSIHMLEKGIVNASSTTISLLGIDLLGIRNVKVITTIDTWIGCGGFLF